MFNADAGLAEFVTVKLAMSLKSKILLLALLPLILMTAAIMLISQRQAHDLSEQEIHTFEGNLLEAKRSELQNYVSLAMTSIAHIVRTYQPGDKAAEEEIKRILHGLTYGDDGYFFAYDQSGVNLVHPKQPELVGKNLLDLQDKHGQFVIRELLREAREGGGYVRYHWRKPSKGDLEDKLSYVVTIPKLNWMMGTGIYVDDIASEVAKIRSQVIHNIRNTFFTVLMILGGTAIIIILIGVAINVHATQLADKRLRAIVHKYVQFQVNQRRNFARELHDGINQLMVSVKFRIELARDRMLSDPNNAAENLDKAEDVLNQAIQEVRQISHDLRPSLLDDLGLKAALVSMLDDFAERTGIRNNIRLQLPEHRLPDDIEITLYRIVQEAITNVERHADANELVLRIWTADDQIRVDVKDNGRGFNLNADDPCEGIGLMNMRERAELLGGSFEIRSRPTMGTRVRATFTLEPVN
ncbi:cache domain-containing protein [Pontibacterium granulatum]|uniref:cache domain-containing protein n=1 Tax=Pontibacterium granulatum TaxID=2036029 RepID=UPI00249AEC29|nr:cache domain-containing protein [Pontibacterium granulatum]MDI3324356.1 cache domain-containing protein [Pontibacterium granulatum]